ncbi:histidine kinase [Chitiniphilus shinanonensis]|uniref:histidine kinase n=1 Tax=Chitiniphilus shinanonensis TaxID=553088 RepID=A0ABQ6BVW0_9NEIS|nr:ATP-binding protein [Chitiniphilus shinanonensis]GLS06098.1 histidine kinase [Chitiniphilus shinanonensis]
MADAPQDALATAIERCAQEPIRVPGSIQPHGFLLALDEPSLRIRHVSASVADWLGHDPEQLPGRALTDLLPPGEALATALLALVNEDDHPCYLGEVMLRCADGGSARFELVAHRHAGRLIAEFEPAPGDGTPVFSAMHPLVGAFVARLQHAGDTDRLCRLAAEEVRRLTGFGRALVYRFDRDGHGQVLAEARLDGYPSYLGQHFPASDIPPQARQLYLSNRLRVIQDADYTPSPLCPPHDPDSGQPLDLGFSMLRSVSPVHLQYMRNMGTLASMSISLVVEGRLWGLISCHHAQPHAVPFHVRTACELLGRIVSLQIEAKEAHADAGRRLELRRLIVQMLSAMADRDSVSAGLLAVSDAFLAFGRASGGAAVAGGHCELIGRAPPQPLVMALARWLGERGGRDAFQSDNIGRDVPELPELARECGGVLAVPISELHAHYLIWFRDEQVRTIDWAGQPAKTADADGRLSPRASFAAWRETVRGHSLPWDEVELDGALELRNAVLGIVLRKAEEMASLAGELQKANKELEAFSYSVSHDLRAPLRHIAGYAELLENYDGKALSERGQRYLAHIAHSVRFAGTLVDNLLSFSQMGRSALHRGRVDLNAIVESVRREMVPDYEGRDIAWTVHPLPHVTGDAAFIHLALRNLVANAIKYTGGREHARIEIGGEARPDETVVYVRDNGVGFDMEYVGKLFGVFQRLHRMEDFEGTGIGLASVRRIVERHDGRVWAEGEPDHGATFYFALPRRAPESCGAGGETDA